MYGLNGCHQVAQIYGRKSSSQADVLHCRSFAYSFLEATLIAESGTLILLSKSQSTSAGPAAGVMQNHLNLQQKMALTQAQTVKQ